MKILSISTSSKICTASILEDNNLIKEKILDSGLTHSEKLLPLINNLITDCNLSLNDFDLFVCDKGPGSFTGIRIGVSTIIAFKDCFNTPSYGISSLEALAYNVKTDGLICSLIDAKNFNCYFSFYRLENEKYTKLGDFGVDHINIILEQLKSYNEPITFVGDGSITYKDIIKSNRNNAIFSSDNDISSYNLGLAGLYNYKSGNLCDILPLYLRKPQAERMLEEKQNANN